MKLPIAFALLVAAGCATAQDLTQTLINLCVPKTSSECDAVMESPKLAG